MREAVESAFQQTEYQRCLIHQVRTAMKYVVEKDRKEFASDLKTIYQAPDESHVLEARERVAEKWGAKYANAVKGWECNWDTNSPIFKFSSQVIKVIYTTNTIESLNSPIAGSTAKEAYSPAHVPF